MKSWKFRLLGLVGLGMTCGWGGCDWGGWSVETIKDLLQDVVFGVVFD